MRLLGCIGERSYHLWRTISTAWLQDAFFFNFPSRKAKPQTLASNAYAQQVLGDTLIYARRSGEHVIVMRARLKPARPPKAPTGRN